METSFILDDQLEYTKHIQRVIEFYNNNYNYIEQLPSFHTGYQYSTNLLEGISLKHGMSNSKTCIELCCGTGGSLIYLAKKYDFKITGIDINKKFIEECRRKISKNELTEKVIVLEENVLDIDRKFEKFDLIWNEDSFSHLPYKEQLFEICHELLNEKGLLVFYDLVKTTNLSKDEHTKICKNWCLWRMESKDSYVSILKNAGFKILELKDDTAKDLIDNHIKANKDLGFDYEFHPDYLTINKDKLVIKWGLENYDQIYERSLVYNYLTEGKLDYVFFVARKI